MHNVSRTLYEPISTDMVQFLRKIERKRTKAQWYGVYVAAPQHYMEEQGILTFAPLYKVEESSTNSPTVPDVTSLITTIDPTPIPTTIQPQRQC